MLRGSRFLNQNNRRYEFKRSRPESEGYTRDNSIVCVEGLRHSNEVSVKHDEGVEEYEKEMFNLLLLSDNKNQDALLSSEPCRSSIYLVRGGGDTISKSCLSSHNVITSKDLKSPTHYPRVGINPLVHSFRALSTLRRSGLRTASAAAKPCQGDSSEFYLITGRIPTVAAAGQRHVNSQPHAHTPYF
ncbi:hypothetical protein Tco_0589263 [Tanacetum coccineum]